MKSGGFFLTRNERIIKEKTDAKEHDIFHAAPAFRDDENRFGFAIIRLEWNARGYDIDKEYSGGSRWKYRNKSNKHLQVQSREMF